MSKNTAFYIAMFSTLAVFIGWRFAIFRGTAQRTRDASQAGREPQGRARPRARAGCVGRCAVRCHPLRGRDEASSRLAARRGRQLACCPRVPRHGGTGGPGLRLRMREPRRPGAAMIVNTKPIYRAIAIGIVAAAVLIGSFLLGSAQSGSAASGVRRGQPFRRVRADLLGAGGKITVTGTGTVTGTPNQLVLSMGVQTSASSVSDRAGQGQCGRQAGDHRAEVPRRAGPPTSRPPACRSAQLPRQQPGSGRLRGQRAAHRDAARTWPRPAARSRRRSPRAATRPRSTGCR